MKMPQFSEKLSRSAYYKRIFTRNKTQIAAFRALLKDDESQKVLRCIFSAYRSVIRPSEYYWQKAASAPCTEPHFVTEEGYQVFGTANPYYLRDIFRITPELVLLDGGAYIGDTIWTLYQLLGEPCAYTYAFEPNEVNHKKLQKFAGNYPNRICCFTCGLDDHEGTENFRMADAGSRICEDGGRAIHVIDAGAFLSGIEQHFPTFIKLDIEGRERQVISSMRGYIRERKPDLAVSIYHNLEDLWEIPLFIHEICPEYSIYIRHQSNYFTETICYATVSEE